MSYLRNEIVNLSSAEKFELLDFLWERLGGDATPLADTQSTDLDSHAGRHVEEFCQALRLSLTDRPLPRQDPGNAGP